MHKFNNQDELAAFIQKFLKSDDGETFMKILEGRFENPPLSPAQAVDGASMAMFTQHRIGEVNVVRWLRAMINFEVGKPGVTDE